MANCRSCGAKIKWITLASGKSHPCDPEKVHLNECEIGAKLVTEHGQIIAVSGKEELYYDEELDYGYVSHFSTCPDANKWRKK